MNEKKGGSKKISGIKGTTRSDQVHKTEGVDNVAPVKHVTGIGQVGGVGAVGKRRSTRIMSLAEREELFKMINEEADKILGATGISPEKQKIIAEAVKMAVDSGLVEAEEDEENPTAKPKNSLTKNTEES